MSQEKIFKLDTLKNRIAKSREKGVTVGLCHGTFDLLHVGHIKHFQEAKSKCDLLVVTVTPDRHINKGPGRPVFSENLRTEAISALECVDLVAINNWPTAIELIGMLKPNFYIKGIDYTDIEKDHSGNIKLEKNAIEKQGGELIITSSQKFSSSNIILRTLSNLGEKQIQFIDNLKAETSLDDFFEMFQNISKTEISLIGETIIDEYVFCETIGKSGKDPMLVNRIIEIEKFLGGIGAIAKICSDFVSKIDLISYLGENCGEIDFIQSQMPKNTCFSYFRKKSSPTIKKTRYLNDYTKQKMIGFYDLNDEPISENDEKKLNSITFEKSDLQDVVIEIDYGHGLISPNFQKLLRKRAKFLAANSQVNSFNAKFRDLNIYKDLDLLCMNEDELRAHYRSRKSPLQNLMQQLKVDLGCKNLIITKGAHGSIGINSDGLIIECPAYAEKVIDRIGSGDAYLAASAIALSLGSSLAVSMFFASVVAGAVVSSMGTGQSGLKQYSWKAIEAYLK